MIDITIVEDADNEYGETPGYKFEYAESAAAFLKELLEHQAGDYIYEIRKVNDRCVKNIERG